MSRYGRATSYAGCGPETTNVSFPASMTFALPLTGAARYWMPLLQHLAQLCRALERDGGALDDHFRFPRSREKPLHHFLHVLPCRHHAEHDVARGELRERVDDFGAVLGERLGFSARAVPQRDVAAALRQARGHLVTHAPGADPAELHVLNRGWQSGVPLRDRAK